MHIPSVRFLGIRSPEYVALANSNANEEFTKKMVDLEMRPTRKESGKIVSTFSWFSVTSFLIVWTLMVIGLDAFVVRLLYPSQLRGIELRDGEFVPAKQHIQRAVQRFTGTAKFAEGGIAYREHVPGAKEYIDEGDEAEQNWDELVKGRYFYITEEEAKAQWPTNYQEWYHDDSGWIIGLDVFHTLHCVKILRHVFHARNSSEPTAAYHVDHCLDVIRQALQCYGDLTPIPLRTFPYHPDPFTDSDQLHTCRDVKPLRQFVTKRRQLHAGLFVKGFASFRSDPSINA